MLTQEVLKQQLSYDETTGVFRRLVTNTNHVKAGDVAGTKKDSGYVTIMVCGRIYQAHRLAWLYVHGVWPTKVIDHINGVRDDNRICNLRDVSSRVNAQNVRRSTVKSVTGMLGAHPYQGKFVSSITANGVNHYLGYFNTAIEAHEAYLAAKRRLHEGCTI